MSAYLETEVLEKTLDITKFSTKTIRKNMFIWLDNHKHIGIEHIKFDKLVWYRSRLYAQYLVHKSFDSKRIGEPYRYSINVTDLLNVHLNKKPYTAKVGYLSDEDAFSNESLIKSTLRSMAKDLDTREKRESARLKESKKEHTKRCNAVGIISKFDPRKSYKTDNPFEVAGDMLFNS